MQSDSSYRSPPASSSHASNPLILTTSSSTTSSHPSNHSSTTSLHPQGSSTPPPFLGKLGTSGDPALTKRRARNLLRDYYGLGGQADNTSNPTDSDVDPTSSGSKLPNKDRSSHRSIGSQETLSIDSPYFDVDAYFNQLVGNSSLKSLLSTANELMSEIRQLDGERQSLVYNHHHELVEASETIDKMKHSSLKLDGTLSQLQDSLSSISQLSTALTSAPPPGADRRREDEMESKFEGGMHLSALLSLPTVLRGLLCGESKAAADQLWGQWEPALRSFEEAGIEGAKQIGNECRDVLRNAKSFSSPV